MQCIDDNNPNNPMDADDEDLEICEECGGTPCDWIKFGEEVLNEIELMYPANERPSDLENKTICKSAYRMFTYLKHGFLGKGNRIPIGYCVIQKIREKWPEEDGNYMGYKSN